jgi:hypothetical protein
MTRTRILSKVLLPCAIGLAAVAGCSSTGQPASAPNPLYPPAANAPTAPSASAAGGAPAAPPPAGSFQEQSLTVGRQFAQCAREHGNPNFPDPALANGGLVWPGVDKQQIDAAEQSCAQILRQLASVPQVLEPPSAETLEHMRQFARCMREHGVTEWPDPKPDGTFPLLGTPLRGLAQYSGEAIPPQVMAARQACVQFEEEWRVAAS